MLVALLVAGLATAPLACLSSGRHTKALIAEVESRIVPGMTRSQVQGVLAELGLAYTPQPEPGRPIWARTPYEQDRLRISWGSINVFFDTQDRVERVEVQYMFSGI